MPTMSFTITPVFPFLVSFLICLSQSPLAASTTTNATYFDTKTAYEILNSFNFPIGLLPKGVKSFDLDQSTGRFHSYLDATCSFSLEGSYQLRYKSTISGYISNNRLTSLSGISVKVLFLWLNIVEVVRNGDNIEFSVGIASASFPIDNFYESPQCGCGLDCLNGQVDKLRTRSFVSSI